MKLNIICAFDAIFDAGNQQFEMIKSASTIEVDLNDGETFFLKVYPLSSKNLLPFAAVLKNKDGKLQAKSPNLQIWKQDEESADIGVLPFKVKNFSLEKIEKEKFNNLNVMFLKGAAMSVFCVGTQDEIFFYDNQTQF